MQQKLRGIVLKQVKYSDTSVIAHVYSDKYGKCSLLARGVRKNKSKNKNNLFQPLSIIDMEVSFKENREIQHIREARHEIIYQTIPYDVHKTTIAIFLAELLDKIIQEQAGNEGLFDFLYHSFQYFDLNNANSNVFHLHFLVKLFSFLGIQPGLNFSEKDRFFHLIKGNFVSLSLSQKDVVDEKNSHYLHQFLTLNYSEMAGIMIDNKDKQQLLRAILDYLHIHVGGLMHIKSLEVLKNVYHQ